MPSKDDIYYQAMLARDYRFDGKFYVGVKTTGVYCRPICPARPARRNVEFFPHPAAAERAGYRPCLRCRPESAPQSPAWFGSSALVQRALRLIAANQLLDTDEDAFAEQFGVSARHLRRLFESEIGQTPKQVSDNNRLNFARKLVTETSLPMTSIALTAGFTSLRRFNASFKSRFHRTPTQLRNGDTTHFSPSIPQSAIPNPQCPPSLGINLTLSYRPPLDWPTLLSFHQSHQIPGLDSVSNGVFERLFHLPPTTGLLQVRPDPVKPLLHLRVITDNPSVLFDVARRVRRMFDLDADPLLVANSFSSIPLLSRLYDRFPGLRIARGFDPFETSISTILGQFVSVPHASSLVGQLVRSYGEKIPHPLTGEPVPTFPTPQTLAASDLSHLKTTTARKQTIREFSRRLLTGELSLSEAQDPATFRQSLLSIKGLGPWSAEYISLRALGDTDAFPARDLILSRVLDLHPNLDLTPLQPWRAYAAIYLWKEFASVLSKRKERVACRSSTSK